MFSLICTLPALYYFVNKEKNTDISPAESRDMNQDCQLLNYYDGYCWRKRKYMIFQNASCPPFFRHDIWHFLGGAGLFFAFMFLLTIDEDIKYKKRTKIPVF